MSAASIAAQFSGPVEVEAVSAGNYVVTVKATDEQFEVQRAFDGRGWHMFEYVDGHTGEWCQHFPTLTEAVESRA